MRKRTPGLTTTRCGEIVSDVEVQENRNRDLRRQHAMARWKDTPAQIAKQTWQPGSGIYIPEIEEP